MPDSIPDTSSDNHSSDPSELNVNGAVDRITEDIERTNFFDEPPIVLYIPIAPEHETGSSDAENLDLRYEDYKNTRPTIYEEGSVYKIPIFLQMNIIPEEVWPMTAGLRNLQFIAEMTTSELSFGACEKIYENGRTYGTIAVISSYTENRVIAMVGHQRFELLEILRQGFESCVEARVKIIKDITLYYPLQELCSNRQTHYLGGHGRMCNKRDLLQCQWPSWVYKQFDVYELASDISKKIRTLSKDVKISDNPIFLSFQVTKIGIFSEAQVCELLGIQSTNLRLQRELHYINNLNVIEEYICAGPDCGAQITNFETVLSTSTEPHKSSCEYWNTSRDMITITQLDNYLKKIKFVNKSTDCTCFPGYNSTSIICRTCNSQLGWIFVVNRSKKSVMPTSFYGLSITALIKTTVTLLPLTT